MPKSINKKVTKDTNKRTKPKRVVEDNPLKPMDIDKELEGVDNFLIKVIVFVETFIINTFIYSIKLVTDLPKLLAYLTPVDRYKVAKSAFIMSIIYNILHYLSSIFGYRIAFIPKPVFHRYTASTTLVLTVIILIISMKYSNKYILENPQEEDEYEEDEYEEGYPPNESTKEEFKDREESLNIITKKENAVEANTWNDEEDEEEWGDSRLPKEPVRTTKKEYKTVPKQHHDTPKTHVNNRKSNTPIDTVLNTSLSVKDSDERQENPITPIQTKESLFTEQIEPTSPFTDSGALNENPQEPLEDYNINIMNLLIGNGIDISVNNTDEDDDIKLLSEDNLEM